MKILGIDSSAIASSAAIFDSDNNKFIASGFINIGLTHSEAQLPLIDSVLSSSKLDINDIDTLAVSVGPGSFTGLRIGISAVKGLAFGENKKVIPVSTLESLVANVRYFDGITIALMDARRGQFYNAFFDNEKRLTEDRVSMWQELLTEIKKYGDKKIMLVGDGAVKFYEKCYEELNAVIAPPHLLYGNAVGVCLAADTKNIINASELMPKYLQQTQAERERLEKLGELK